MKAVEMCLNTKKLLDNRSEIHGYVHSVFNRVCNIVTKDDLLIPVISNFVPNTPRSISLDLPMKESIKSLGLSRGMEIIIKNNVLKTVEEGFSLDLSEAKIWDAKPKFGSEKVEKAQFLKNLDILLSTFLHEGKFAGIAPVCLDLVENIISKPFGDNSIVNNHYSSFILPRILKLIDAYTLGSTELLKAQAKQIVGFGPGLTPSADDFLTGFMVANIYAANYYGQEIEGVMELNRAISEDAEYRTTKVSSEMLHFASVGEVSENTRALMLSLFSDKNEAKLINNIRSVINNGETSGSDLIAGAYIGCILSLYNRKERTDNK